MSPCPCSAERYGTNTKERGGEKGGGEETETM